MASVNGVSFQNQLVSGSTLKTIDSNNMLGSGNASVLNGSEGISFVNIIHTDGTSVNGTTTETITYSSLITAYSLSDNSFFDLSCRCVKSVNSSAWSVRVYKNTTNSLTGATIIATIVTIGSSLFCQFLREFRIVSGTLKSWGTTSTGVTDQTTSTTAESSTSFDVTIDNYILITIQLGSSTGGDIAKGAFLLLTGY